MRVGVLWRGPAGESAPREDRGLGPLFRALSENGVEVVPVPYDETRHDEVRARLRPLPGLLVWVNPIQDGVDRRRVDELLAEVEARGAWVSASLRAVQALGTKEVLYRTRALGWGSDVERYRTRAELADLLPARLERWHRLVVKQGRGNGGDGVWSVALADPDAAATADAPVEVCEARSPRRPPEVMALAAFLERCGRSLEWSRVLVDQPFQARLGEGMVRCYLSHDEVVGFCHQWPQGLLEPDAPPPPSEPRRMEPGDAPRFQGLRERMESEWVPSMCATLGLAATDLPVVWDADFFYGEGDDAFVLGEVNVSAVWPFPPTACPTVAANVAAALAIVGSTPASGGDGEVDRAR